MKQIILTVQPTGKKWRLGLSTVDSRECFAHKDFGNKNLSKWVEENNFQDYLTRNPSKLIFDLSNSSIGKILTFLRKTSP